MSGAQDGQGRKRSGRSEGSTLHDPIVRFHGAAGTVTGSCFTVETEAALVLVDCGLCQGSKTEKELN